MVFQASLKSGYILCKSWQRWSLGQKKKLYWRNPTDPKIRPDPTFFFKTKTKKNKKQKNDRPILKKAKPVIFFINIGSKNVNFGVWDLVGSLKCVFLYVFHIPAEISILPKNVTTLLHWADDMKCLINSVQNSSSKKKKKKSLPTYLPIFVQPVTPI